MTSSGAATVTLPTDEQILIVREFDAPKDLVYGAWSTPELVKRWWGGARSRVSASLLAILGPLELERSATRQQRRARAAERA